MLYHIYSQFRTIFHWMITLRKLCRFIQFRETEIHDKIGLYQKNEYSNIHRRLFLVKVKKSISNYQAQ